MVKEVHGLAGSIRRSQESETFDLAGKSAQTIEHVIRDAFGDPFEVAGLRLTFVTGAGKLARQKYDEAAAKTVTSALQAVGYEESQGGGDGTFKIQHDTGKNLKTVVVFPKVAPCLADQVGGLSLGDEAANEQQPLIDPSTPGYKIIHTPINTFRRMIESHCPSWSQKRLCVAAIDALKALVEDFDAKLLKGTLLTDVEQNLYDSVSIESLDEKQSAVRELMHKQVDAGQLTALEKTTLLEQVQERIDTVTKELEAAKAKGNAAIVKKLETAQQKGLERQQKLRRIQAKPPPPLKRQSDINKLRKELTPLIHMKINTKGRLLSVKESQAMARKEEIEEEIFALEEASRGWFESDEMFEARCQAGRRAHAEASKKAPKSADSEGSKRASMSKWVVPSSTKKTASKSTAKKKSGGGGVFTRAAILMDDSDSD